jgi:hypothetical protein
MELRRVSFNTWDLFQGNGWDNATRIRKGRNGTYVLVGQRLPRHMLRDLDAVLHPRFPITYGMSVEQTINNLNVLERH